MGIQHWESADDEDVQSFRTRTRFDRAIAFLDAAVDALEADKAKSEEATDLPKS